MLISIRPGIWWCFKKRVLRCKIYIRSGMFSFGLANFLSLSDRMSDMLKKFSTSLSFQWIRSLIWISKSVGLTTLTDVPCLPIDSRSFQNMLLVSCISGFPQSLKSPWILGFPWKVLENEFVLEKYLNLGDLPWNSVGSPCFLVLCILNWKFGWIQQIRGTRAISPKKFGSLRSQQLTS